MGKMARNFLPLLVCAFVCAGLPQTILAQDGTGLCLQFGCDPQQTFSLYTFGEKVPTSDVKLLWNSSLTAPIGPEYPGCVACPSSLLCPGNTPFGTSFIAVDPSSGERMWQDDILRYPVMPFMDTYGDFIASDGTKVISFISNGTSQGSHDFFYPERPLYHLTITPDSIFLIAPQTGLLSTYYTNGIPHAGFFLNSTIQGEKGCFYPIAMPATQGQRAFLLEQFRPDNASKDIFCRRLYGLDMMPVMAPRDTVAWSIDLDDGCYATGPAKTFQDPPTTRGPTEGDGIYAPTFYKVLAANNEVLVAINNTKFTDSSSDDTRQVHVFKNHPNAKQGEFKHVTNFPASDFAFLGAPFYNGTTVWGLDASGGTVMEIDYMHKKGGKVLDFNSILDANVTITSKLMVAAVEPDNPPVPTDNLQQVLVFGATLSSPGHRFYRLVREMGLEGTEGNYLIAIGSDTERVLWLVASPNNGVIKGQINMVTPNSSSGRQDSDKAFFLAYSQRLDQGNTAFFAAG